MKKGYLYIALTAFIFSTAEIATKFVANQINPIQLTFIRFLVGGLFLLPFAIMEIRRRHIRLTVKDLLTFAMLGAVGITVSMPLFQSAVVYAKAGTVAVIFSANTIFVAFFAVVILKEKFTAVAAAAIALGLIGILCLLNPLAASPDTKGILLALASALFFALYSVLAGGKVRQFGGFITNSISFIAGSLLLLPLMAFTNTPVIQGITLQNLPIVLYICLIVTGLGYMLYFTAMKDTSAIETSSVFFIKPALAPVLSLIILGEAIRLNTLLGIAFIVAGAFLLFWRKARVASREARLGNPTH